MSEPVRLTVIIPYLGEQVPPFRLCDECGYTAPNLLPAHHIMRDPVTEVARELRRLDAGTGAIFALMNERSEILFAGPVGFKR